MNNQKTDVMSPEEFLIKSVHSNLIENVKFAITVCKNTNNIYEKLLVFTSENGYTEILKYLVKSGADIHYDNDCAFFNAARHEHMEMLKFLYKLGAKFDLTTLNEATKYNHIKVIEFLLPYIFKSNKNKIFISAIYWKHNEIAKLLVENGADVNYNNNYALLYTVQQDDEEMVNFLLMHGSIVNDEIKKYINEEERFNENNYVITNNKNVIQNIKENNSKIKNIYKLIINAKKEINKEEINNNDNVERQKNTLNILLMKAIKGHSIECVKFLIRQGADVNNNNFEPLKHAMEIGDIEITKYLLSLVDIQNYLISLDKKI